MMHIKTPTLLLALGLAALGCKEEKSDIEKARESALEALQKAGEAAKMAGEAAKQAGEVAGEAGRAAGEAGKAAGKAGEGAGKSGEDLAKAMENMGKAFTGAGVDKVEPVSFRKLKALVPEKAAGMERKKFSGEKAGAMGIKVSHAKAKFVGEDGGYVNLEITDMGTMKGMAGMAIAAWAHAEIERESDDGFERTFEYEGNKAFEKFTERGMRTEIHVLVAGRFVIKLIGRKVPFKTVKGILEEIEIDDLEAMKNEGVKAK